MSEHDAVWCGFCNAYVPGSSFAHHIEKHVRTANEERLRKERARRGVIGRADRLSKRGRVFIARPDRHD